MSPRRHARLVRVIRRQLEDGADHLTLTRRQVDTLRSTAPPAAQATLGAGRLGALTGIPIVLRRSWRRGR